MNPDSPTLYEVLGVAPDATDTQLKTAWRLAAKATHPDAGGDPQAFTAAQHAWEVLSDPGSRASYDAALAGEGDPDVEAPDNTDILKTASLLFSFKEAKKPKQNRTKQK